MSTVKNYTTIYLQLNQIGVLDVTILLMTFFDKVCLPNNIEDLSIHVFNMITGIIESKILKKHISSEYNCKFNIRKYDSNKKQNNNKSQCECKKTSYM